MRHPLEVWKFGGALLADAAALRKAAELAAGHPGPLGHLPLRPPNPPPMSPHNVTEHRSPQHSDDPDTPGTRYPRSTAKVPTKYRPLTWP